MIRYEGFLIGLTLLVAACGGGGSEREPDWTESLAVGRREFVTGVKAALGAKAHHRDVEAGTAGFILREPPVAYGYETSRESGPLRPMKRPS